MDKFTKRIWSFHIIFIGMQPFKNK